MLCLLRIYPERFGQHVAKLMPKLTTKGEGLPPDSHLSPLPADQLLGSQPWTNWDEADLITVLRYVRGNKSLNLPSKWKALVPRVL